MYKKINNKKILGFISLTAGIILVCLGFFYTKPKVTTDVNILPLQVLSVTTSEVNKINSVQEAVEEWLKC